MTAVVGKAVDYGRAADWVRGSLALGSQLAALVGAKLTTFANAALLVEPSRVAGVELDLDDNGRGLPSSEADDLATRLLASVAHAGKVTLIVEDDLARFGDPHLAGVAYVGDRVLRWEQIDDDARGAAALLRKGSSGYPLNAYLCAGAASELGLSPGADVPPVLVERIAGSIVGVIVSVWDAEAFVAVLSPVLSD